MEPDVFHLPVTMASFPTIIVPVVPEVLFVQFLGK